MADLVSTKPHRPNAVGLLDARQLNRQTITRLISLQFYAHRSGLSKSPAVRIRHAAALWPALLSALSFDCWAHSTGRTSAGGMLRTCAVVSPLSSLQAGALSRPGHQSPVH